MEAIIIHPADNAQQAAILTILDGLHIPYEKEMGDETDRLLSNPAMVDKIEQSRKDMNDGKGTAIPIEEIWK